MFYEPSQRLRWAIINDKLPIVEHILKRWPDLLENPDPRHEGWTSLHYAAYHGRHTICVFLITAGHDRDEISLDFNRNTALHLAAQQNREQTVHYLAQHLRRCLSWPNASQDTPLLVAARAGHQPSLTLLLDFGADVDEQGKDGDRAIHIAAAFGQVKTIRTLAERKADLTSPNALGWTPKDYCYSYQTQDFLAALIAKNTKKNLTNPNTQLGTSYTPFAKKPLPAPISVAAANKPPPISSSAPASMKLPPKPTTPTLARPTKPFASNGHGSFSAPPSTANSPSSPAVSTPIMPSFPQIPSPASSPSSSIVQSSKPPANNAPAAPSPLHHTSTILNVPLVAKPPNFHPQQYVFPPQQPASSSSASLSGNTPAGSPQYRPSTSASASGTTTTVSAPRKSSFEQQVSSGLDTSPLPYPTSFNRTGSFSSTTSQLSSGVVTLGQPLSQSSPPRSRSDSVATNASTSSSSSSSSTSGLHMPISLSHHNKQQPTTPKSSTSAAISPPLSPPHKNVIGQQFASPSSGTSSGISSPVSSLSNGTPSPPKKSSVMLNSKNSSTLLLPEPQVLPSVTTRKISLSSKTLTPVSSMTNTSKPPSPNSKQKIPSPKSSTSLKSYLSLQSLNAYHVQPRMQSLKPTLSSTSLHKKQVKQEKQEKKLKEKEKKQKPTLIKPKISSPYVNANIASGSTSSNLKSSTSAYSLSSSSNTKPSTGSYAGSANSGIKTSTTIYSSTSSSSVKPSTSLYVGSATPQTVTLQSQARRPSSSTNSHPAPQLTSSSSAPLLSSQASSNLNTTVSSSSSSTSTATVPTLRAKPQQPSYQYTTPSSAGALSGAGTRDFPFHPQQFPIMPPQHNAAAVSASKYALATAGAPAPSGPAPGTATTTPNGTMIGIPEHMMLQIASNMTSTPSATASNGSTSSTTQTSVTTGSSGGALAGFNPYFLQAGINVPASSSSLASSTSSSTSSSTTTMPSISPTSSNGSVIATSSVATIAAPSSTTSSIVTNSNCGSTVGSEPKGNTNQEAFALPKLAPLGTSHSSQSLQQQPQQSSAPQILPKAHNQGPPRRPSKTHTPSSTGSNGSASSTNSVNSNSTNGQSSQNQAGNQSATPVYKTPNLRQASSSSTDLTTSGSGPYPPHVHSGISGNNSQHSQGHRVISQQNQAAAAAAAAQQAKQKPRPPLPPHSSGHESDNHHVLQPPSAPAHRTQSTTPPIPPKRVFSNSNTTNSKTHHEHAQNAKPNNGSHTHADKPPSPPPKSAQRALKANTAHDLTNNTLAKNARNGSTSPTESSDSADFTKPNGYGFDLKLHTGEKHTPVTIAHPKPIKPLKPPHLHNFASRTPSPGTLTNGPGAASKINGHGDLTKLLASASSSNSSLVTVTPSTVTTPVKNHEAYPLPPLEATATAAAQAALAEAERFEHNRVYGNFEDPLQPHNHSFEAHHVPARTPPPAQQHHSGFQSQNPVHHTGKKPLQGHFTTHGASSMPSPGHPGPSATPQHPSQRDHHPYPPMHKSTKTNGNGNSSNVAVSNAPLEGGVEVEKTHFATGMVPSQGPYGNVHLAHVPGTYSSAHSEEAK